MSTFDELRNQLRQTKTQAAKTSVANKLSFDEARNAIHKETTKNNTQKAKEVQQPTNPFPHRSDLKAEIANNQPAPNVETNSFLKPIDQTLKGNVIDLKLPTPKKTGYVIGGLTVGDGKGGGFQDKRPVTILSDDGRNVTVENQDGFKQIVPKQYLSTSPISQDKEKMLLRNAQEISKRQSEQSLADSYKDMNPVESFFTKANDIGFKQIENTPSLGNPVADVASNIIGTLMSLATPTGGGNSLGGAMNTAGDIVQAGIQKNAGNVINKLPKLAQKLLPRATREVGEGLVYSASKAPDYTAKDWATNAVQDATIGTALGSVMDGVKNIPDAIDNAKIKAKSKAIDAKYEQLKTDMFPSQKSNAPNNILKPIEPKLSVKPTTINKSLSLKNTLQNQQASDIPKYVQRIEEPGVKRASIEKPHGIYTSPSNVDSPHQFLGGDTYYWETNPKANVLKVKMGMTETNRGGLVGEASGIAAAKQLFGNDEINRMMKLPKKELAQELTNKYPNVEWGKYYDQQEMIEGLAGIKARENGYDAIWALDNDPEFNEYVGLTKNAFIAEVDEKQLKSNNKIDLLKKGVSKQNISSKAYNVFNTVAKQGSKKPTINIDGQRYAADIPKPKPIEPLKKIETPVPKQAEPIENNPLKDSWLQTFAGETAARKQSQFAQNTIKRATIIPDDMKAMLNLDNITHNPETVKAWQDTAEKNIMKDEAAVLRKIYDSPSLTGGVQSHEAAILTSKYVSEAKETGSVAKVRSWISTLSARARETGRAMKGLDSAFEKSSKEGKLIQAQRTIDGVEEDFKKSNPIKSKQMESEINETKSAVKKAKKEAAKEATDEIAKEIQDEVEKEAKDFVPNKSDSLKAKDNNINQPKKLPTKINENKQLSKANGNKIPTKSNGNKQPKNLPNKLLGKKKPTPEELLANRVQSTLKNPLKKNDPIKTMVNELFKIAKESPLPEYDKIKGKTSFDFIKEAIENKAQYKEVWTKAKDILREKFKDNEDAFNMLDDYFTRNNPVKPVFSNARLQQSVQTALKDLGLKLDTIARQDAGDKDKFLSNITKYIVDKTNATIDKEEATRLAKRIQKRYFELVDKKSQSILKNLTKEMPEKQRKTFYEKLRELNNLGAFEDEAIASAIKEKYGIPILSDSDVNFIIKTMDIIKDKDPLSYEYRAAMSKVNEKIVNKLPVTKQEKLQAFSRIMMLFNPKTLITRNPLGNAILGGFEAFKDMPSSLVDMYVSAKYGVERQTLFPSWSKLVNEFSGAKKGLKEFKMDIKRGVDTSETGAQYELPKYGKRIFQNPILNFMDQLTRKGLQAGDRPFFEAAKSGRLGELKKIKGTNTVTDEMYEDAFNYAMDRTYQNKSKMADAAKGLQKNINIIGSKVIPGTSESFGLGNLAMPFTTTPANILQKAIEYSPLGILDTVRAWKDFRKGATNQKQFTSLVGRMFTGTGLMLLGWELAKNGMASGKGSNSDKEKAFNAASGENQYSLKIGTNRFTFDWADPLSLPLAVGIDMMEAGKDKEGLLDAASKGLVSGGDTFFKKSFMRGLSQMMGGYSPTQGIVNTVLSSATQFTPSAGNMAAKIVDNTRRETYDPNKIKELLNKVVISRTPFLSKTLPPKIDTMGKEMKQSEAPRALKILDVALSPGYYSKQKETPGIKFIKDLYEEKGDTKVFPKVASKTITIKDKVTKEKRKIDLTAKEWTQLQKTIGTNTMARIEEFARNNNVKTGDPNELVKEVYKIIDEEGDKATAELQEKYKNKLGFN